MWYILSQRVACSLGTGEPMETPSWAPVALERLVREETAMLTIRNPVEWGVDQVKRAALAIEEAGHAVQQAQAELHSPAPRVARIGAHRYQTSAARRVRRFRREPHRRHRLVRDLSGSRPRLVSPRRRSSVIAAAVPARLGLCPRRPIRRNWPLRNEPPPRTGHARSAGPMPWVWSTRRRLPQSFCWASY